MVNGVVVSLAVGIREAEKLASLWGSTGGVWGTCSEVIRAPKLTHIGQSDFGRLLDNHRAGKFQ